MSKPILNTVRTGLAVIGGLAVTLVALAMIFTMLWVNSFSQPIKWPKPTRDCLDDHAPHLTEAELIDKGYAAWEADASRYSEAYRQKYAGGPVLRDRTKLGWVSTEPKDWAGYTANDYNNDYSVRQAFHRAEHGLKRYAVVRLTLYAPQNTDGQGEPRLTTQAYEFDACGAPL